MKRLYIAFVLTFLFLPSVDAAFSRPGWTYWNNWKSSFSKLVPETDKEKAQTINRYSQRMSTISPTTIRRYLDARRAWEYSPVERDKTSIYFSRNAQQVSNDKSSNSRYEDQRNNFYHRYIQKRNQNQKSVLVSARALKQRRPVQEINSDVIPAFILSVSNRSYSGTDFPEAALLETLQFQMISQGGIAEDPTDFELVVNNDQGFRFEEDGTVSIQFQNARIAQGQNMQIDIGVRVRNPDLTPSFDGAFRLRLVDAMAVTELDQKSVRTSVSGGAVTDMIAFDPLVHYDVPSNFNAREIHIYGKTLSAGNKEYVLALNLEAYYDDMLVEEIIVQDSLSRGTIDSFAEKLTAYSADTGKVLASGRFVNGAARMVFKNPIKIQRGGDRYKILFQIEIDEKVNTTYNQFKLSVDPRDMKVSGIGSGREIPDSYKNVSAESDVFEVVQSGGDMYVTPSPEQPEGLVVLSNKTTQVFRFAIYNQEYNSLSVARVSLVVRLSGLQFPDGRSVDDFELKQLYQGREVNAIHFTPTLRGDDIVQFDADRELLLDRYSEAQFVLKLKLENVGPDNEYDSVAVQVLGDDDSVEKGTLEDVRSAGTNFIWSDMSGRPHTAGSEDWMSGYLVRGLPTNFKVINR